MDDDFPRTMQHEEVRSRRRAALSETHMLDLTNYVKHLRGQYPFDETPDFDPFDGGVNAQALFLFEKPGPKTSENRGGSGFISRNNDDPTAESTLGFMREAGLCRKDTIIWNAIPGWNETTSIAKGEARRGMEELPGLIKLLPRLQVVVLVGKRAQAAKRICCATNQRLATIDSPHPSSRVKAANRPLWDSIPAIWAKVKDHIK